MFPCSSPAQRPQGWPLPNLGQAARLCPPIEARTAPPNEASLRRANARRLPVLSCFVCPRRPHLKAHPPPPPQPNAPATAPNPPNARATMRSLPLVVLPSLLACATVASASDMIAANRIKVQLFAAPAFFSEVSVDAYDGQCLSLDNNL